MHALNFLITYMKMFYIFPCFNFLYLSLQIIYFQNRSNSCQSDGSSKTCQFLRMLQICMVNWQDVESLIWIPFTFTQFFCVILRLPFPFSSITFCHAHSSCHENPYETTTLISQKMNNIADITIVNNCAKACHLVYRRKKGRRESRVSSGYCLTGM